ncbi:putative RING-H2 finger protein ATL62 [Cryptomeria japonica]|uniref:putative RING-H2 finger protein ATL62 n=1 Tax=Cryptomeria japonica TaxID=3369 RepID=UPI0025AD0238|nr:putative RING-H2 finger protein ATL62 [Cryptomeria japonica]
MAASVTSQIQSALGHVSVLLIIAPLFALAIIIKAICNDCCYARSRRNGFDHPDNDFPTMENRGLDKESLDGLPIAEYKSQSMSEDLECVVCLSNFEENEKIRVLNSCNHSFHVECINMWLQSHTSCPICRQRVSSNGSPTIMSSSRGREDTSSTIDGTSVSVVRLHLVRGQRSSRAVQQSNRVNVLMLMNEALSHQGMYAGRQALHTAINIGPY